MLSLDGSPGYPQHDEAIDRMAKVIQRFCVSVDHARAAIEQFDAGYPTVEQFRDVAWRLREKFDPETKAERDAEMRSVPHDVKKFVRKSVPLIPGVPWEVCLQLQCIRLSVKGEFEDDRQRLAGFEREFPETVADVRAGLEPDLNLLAARMGKPNEYWAAVKNKLKLKTFQGTDSLVVARAWKELGFPLLRYQEEILRAAGEL